MNWNTILPSKDNETQFAKIAKRNGFGVVQTQSTDSINQYKYDYRLAKGMIQISVKLIAYIPNIWQPKLNDKLWIELKTEHTQGWLYQDFDIVAFETDQSFILVSRLDLMNYLDGVVNTKKPAWRGDESALHHIYYSRTKTAQTMIEQSDVASIVWDVWFKESIT